MHFSGLFKDILVKEEVKEKKVTADGLMAICSGFFFCFLFFFFIIIIYFFFPSSCKIGVWLNTCKLCCDYQPLKSSLKINLYIVKFPCVIILYLLSEFFKCSEGKFIFKYAAVISTFSFMISTLILGFFKCWLVRFILFSWVIFRCLGFTWETWDPLKLVN